MSATYQAVMWNRQKRLYDFTLIGLLLAALGLFVGVSLVTNANITVETMILRGTSVSALVMLHVILAIGPLARVDRRFLPLLYNRRHLGVTMFLLALVHAVFAVIQFHGLGDRNPLVSVFTAYREDYRLLVNGAVNAAHFPFEPLGAFALVILFFMAATSHDFWLRTLGASFWKTMHMLVYVAYGLVLGHVAFGALQSERSIGYPVMLALGFGFIASLHVAAALKERRLDNTRALLAADGFVVATAISELREARAKIVIAGGQRVAIWLHNGRVFGTGNVCRHQGGPVGEGKIIDGCVTCPWHGWNYQPEDGCSPPPFDEVIPTFDTRVVDDQVWVKAAPNPLCHRGSGALIGRKGALSA